LLEARRAFGGDLVEALGHAPKGVGRVALELDAAANFSAAARASAR